MNRQLRQTREYFGNRYVLVRDCIQYKKPFVIYNFTNSSQYNQVLYDIDKYGKLNYATQTLHSISENQIKIRRSFPSIFITNEGTNISLDSFKEMAKGSISHYSLDSIICLYDGAISVFYKNNEYHAIGNSIYSSNQIYEFNSDFYQIESVYYSFI